MGKNKKLKKQILKSLKSSIKDNKEKRQYKLEDGEYVFGKDIAKAVNEFDKEFGIKLKHPSIWADPGQSYNVLESKADMSLKGIICVLNNIPLSTYYNIHVDKPGSDFIARFINEKRPKFTKISSLQWGTNINFKNTSLIFRSRFATLVCSRFIGNIETILDKIPRAYNHSQDEQKILGLTKFMQHVTLFSQLMCSKESGYTNILLKMNEYLMYSKKKNVNKTSLRLSNLFISNIKSGVSSSPFNKEKFGDDDMLIYEILKAAYSLATGKGNAVKRLPRFKDIEGATIEYNLSGLIEELGIQILRESNFSPIFESYLEAHPYIKTEFSDEANDNAALNIGLYAIDFVGFICNNRSVTKFIKHMFEDGF